MENESKIIELLTESLIRQDRMVERMDTTNQKLDNTVNRLDETNRKLGNLEVRADRHEKRMESIENQLIKLNLQTVENSRAIFKVAEKIDQIADLHNRITKLEKTVFK